MFVVSGVVGGVGGDGVREWGFPVYGCFNVCGGRSLLIEIRVLDILWIEITDLDS